MSPAPTGGYDCVVWGSVSARARLPIGETTEPPPELRGREGILPLKSSAATQPGTHEGCTPLELPLP